MFSFANEKNDKQDLKYKELEKLVWEFFMNKIPKLGFESREGQEDMALDICSSIRDKQHTIVEAGVGIGKSYAYIVPLMYYNMIFNKPVIIATSTIALQEQLIKDIKTISIHIKHKPEIILAKGMSHFVCKERGEKYFKNIPVKELSEESNMLRKYIEIGKVDRKNINMDVSENLWEMVNVKPTQHSKCKYFKSCRFMELREKMINTKGVIICNQDLLTVHLQKLKRGQKGLLNTDVDIIVIDEAHNLEEKVRSSLVENYSIRKIQGILNELSQDISKGDVKSTILKGIRVVNSLLYKLFNILDKQIKDQISNGFKGEEAERYFINTKEVKDLFQGLIKNINNIYSLGKVYSSDNLQDETLEETFNLILFFKNAIDVKGRYLFWLEKNNTIKIHSCPKNMDMEIRKLYFDRLKTTILTSATIANKNHGNEEERYEYFIKNTGFPVEKGFLSPQKFSPFPYKENTILYYTENMPHPTHQREEFIKMASQKIESLLNITKGKALILFTSKSDLNEVYSILKGKNLGYNIIKQRSMSSQDEILEEFKNDEDSVLLATGTFWEGIDVPGKALSNLIIFRLPFPPPDPILEYKKNTSKDFLMEVSVPLMVVKLRQGVGRLIRKHTDTGIVSILDSRIGDNSSSSYKKIVFDSIPMKNRTKDINKVKDFWSRVQNKY